jgi:arsenate reductase
LFLSWQSRKRAVSSNLHCIPASKPGILSRSREGDKRKNWKRRGPVGIILASQSRIFKMDVTIFHNNRCGTSRNTLAALREAGIEPRVVDYLAQPPSREALKDMIARAGLTPRDAVRSKEAVYAELGLGDPATTDDALLDAMVAHPILINRPFVVTTKGVRLCRPAELVREIL